MKKKEEKEIFERSWKKKCIKAKAVDQILPLLGITSSLSGYSSI